MLWFDEKNISILHTWIGSLPSCPTYSSWEHLTKWYKVLSASEFHNRFGFIPKTPDICEVDLMEPPPDAPFKEVDELLWLLEDDELLPTDCHVFLKTGPIMITISSSSSTDPTQVVSRTCPNVFPLACDAGWPLASLAYSRRPLGMSKPLAVRHEDKWL